MDQYELVRTGYRVYGKNISELARLTGHSRNTVKKALRGEPWGYKERSRQLFPALGDYLAIIESWLENDKDKLAKQRHTTHRIYNRLLDEHGYKGSESTVRRYVRFARMRLGIDTPCAFIPCDPEAGHEAEVDLHAEQIFRQAFRPFLSLRAAAGVLRCAHSLSLEGSFPS